jgi:phosphate uptake regulator
MFEKFKELFGSENLLDMAFDTTVTMLEFDQEMFAASRDTLRHTASDTLPFDVRQMDRKINKYEREVRRNVLTHLSVAGTQNLVPGLVLVSIVIDVERIGDYTKNIVDLASLHKSALKGGKYEKILTEIEGRIETHFAKTIDVLRSHDKRTASSVMALEEETANSAETIVSDMIQNKDKSLSTSDSVTLAMYARYLKRINAHLTNIASAIVNPFPRIGFREKKKK